MKRNHLLDLCNPSPPLDLILQSNGPWELLNVVDPKMTLAHLAPKFST
jgi:hypothetical protein